MRSESWMRLEVGMQGRVLRVLASVVSTDDGTATTTTKASAWKHGLFQVARSRQQASIVMASPGRKLLKGKRFDDSWFSVSVILFLHLQYPTKRFHVRGWRQRIINTFQMHPIPL